MKQQKLQDIDQTKQQETEKQKSEIDLLKTQIEELENKLIEARQNQLRSFADYQNLVKRVEKEKQDWVRFASEGLLLRLLDLADNLDRATIFVQDKGLQMVYMQLQQLLKEYGVKEIDVLGKEFDPNLMECMDKAKGEPNKVLEVKLKGYLLHDRILRPAKVIVGV